METFSTGKLNMYRERLQRALSDCPDFRFSKNYVLVDFPDSGSIHSGGVERQVDLRFCNKRFLGEIREVCIFPYDYDSRTKIKENVEVDLGLEDFPCLVYASSGLETLVDDIEFIGEARKSFFKLKEFFQKEYNYSYNSSRMPNNYVIPIKSLKDPTGYVSLFLKSVMISPEENKVSVSSTSFKLIGVRGQDEFDGHSSNSFSNAFLEEDSFSEREESSFKWYFLGNLEYVLGHYCNRGFFRKLDTPPLTQEEKINTIKSLGNLGKKYEC